MNLSSSLLNTNTTSKVIHSFIQQGKVIVAAILFQSAFSTYNAAGATITLTTSDGLGNSSFNAAGNWSSASAPSAGNTYSVGAGVTLRTPGTSGNFTFAGDSLTITGASAALMYKGTGNNTITVNDLQLGNGGTFSNGAANTTATLSGTVKLLSGGGIFDAVGDATNTRQLVIAANVTGVGSLSIRSTGTPGGIVTLTGSNNYTGTTTISGSNTRLQLAKEVSLYGGSIASWTSANITINASCTLGLNVGGVGEFTAVDIATLLSLGTSTSGFKNGSFIGLDTTNAPGGSFVYGNVIANTNSGSNVIGLKKFGTNTLILTAANTYTGDTVINSGTLQLGNGTIDGSISSSSNVLNNAALVYNVTGNQSYSGIISGSGSLTKLSGGNLILGGINTYTGATSITAGTLSVNGSLGASAVSVSNTATLNGSGTINGAVVNSGTISGGLTFNNNVTINGGATASATAFNGDIVNNGTITSAVNLGSGKTLSGSGSVTNAVSGTSATINGSGLTVGATTLYGSSTLSGYNIASSVTVAGGTATLTGTTKSISALSVGVGATLNANGTIDGNATISGLLKGNSTITGNLSLTSGTLSSGNSAGITTVNNDFTMDDNSRLVVEVSGTVAGSSYDQVKVSGNVSLAGTLDLGTLSGLTLGDTITLIENLGSGTTTGYFSTIITSGSTYTVTTSGSTYTFAVGTTEYEINYSANADAGIAYNDVTLTVVPEPGTWAMLVGGIGMLAFGQRLRRGRK